MSEAILITQELRKAYGDVKTVDGISLQVARGEVFGLSGPNGAGKTTAISMLTALFPPDSGSITVDGLDLSTDPQTVKAKLGLVPQELALYPTLSARQNLNFFGRIYGLRGKTLEARVDEALEMAGLTDRADDARYCPISPPWLVSPWCSSWSPPGASNSRIEYRPATHSARRRLCGAHCGPF
jgi:ABC-2 type transport system ATP-binding protein